MKYICTKQDNGIEEIFIFPMTVNHDCMAEIIGYTKNQTGGNWERVRRLTISAGFVNSDWVCYGQSESLNLDSRTEDTGLLEKLQGI